jgi:thioredoxin 1
MKSVFYFTADWCNPCKKVKPIVEELNREQAEANFQIIDVDIEMELTRKFEVRSVPTFILIKDGIEVNRITGAQTRDSLIGFING